MARARSPNPENTYTPSQYFSTKSEEKKDVSIKFDIFIKFKDMEDEDPIELLEVETLDDLLDALKRLLSWPFIASLREIAITLEEAET